MSGEGAGDEGPGRAEIDFSVFGEEGREGGFFSEGAGDIIGGGKGVDLCSLVRSGRRSKRMCEIKRIVVQFMGCK